jgi:hypothetical protein
MHKVLTGLLKLGRDRKQAAHVDRLTVILRRFTVERQQVPKDFAELVAMNYLEAVPQPPDGHKYVIDRKRVEVRLE